MAPPDSSDGSASLGNGHAPREASLATIAVHGGTRSSKAEGSAILPIYQTTTFSQREEDITYESVRYTRCCNNPNQEAAGASIAALHGAEAGMVTASGMGAISTALLAVLRAGDHLLVQKGLYGGTYSLVTHNLPDYGITYTEIDSRDPSTWEAALKPNTEVIYVETICNPLTNIADLGAVVAFARKHELVSLVDNTFASPVLCRPIQLGFDIVLESATKYLNGHSDVIAGAYVGSAELVQKITGLHIHLGASLDPHACFLLQRGMQTLPLRVKAQAANALALATFLEQQPQVRRVHYAGLPSHADHKLCKAYLGGCGGGVFSFDLHGSGVAAKQFLKAMQIPMLDPSLGGVQTLVSQPARSSHAGMTPEQRQAAGIQDSTIRVAVGIEEQEDLIEDFRHSLSCVKS